MMPIFRKPQSVDRPKRYGIPLDLTDQSSLTLKGCILISYLFGHNDCHDDGSWIQKSFRGGGY